MIDVLRPIMDELTRSEEDRDLCNRLEFGAIGEERLPVLIDLMPCLLPSLTKLGIGFVDAISPIMDCGDDSSCNNR